MIKRYQVFALLFSIATINIKIYGSEIDGRHQELDAYKITLNIKRLEKTLSEGLPHLLSDISINSIANKPMSLSELHTCVHKAVTNYNRTCDLRGLPRLTLRIALETILFRNKTALGIYERHGSLGPKA